MGRKIIEQLGLSPHPEGGWFRETYRSGENMVTSSGKTRSSGTAIYYLLQNEEKSRFHRLSSDELWFFHSGVTIELVTQSDEGNISHYIGNDIGAGEVPQFLIPAGTWFAAKLKDGKGYALVSCSVIPGFEYEDFEMDHEREF